MVSEILYELALTYDEAVFLRILLSEHHSECELPRCLNRDFSITDRLSKIIGDNQE